MDWYTICLLAWFFGMETSEVQKLEWAKEEIDKEQAYCIAKHADPVEYFR